MGYGGAEPVPAGTEGAGTTGVPYPDEGSTGAGALEGTTEGRGTGGTKIMLVMHRVKCQFVCQAYLRSWREEELAQWQTELARGQTGPQKEREPRKEQHSQSWERQWQAGPKVS
jgi:hypothetical protein